MSFVGGGSECSVNGNAVAQFNKHTQQDRSLQRQTAGSPGFVQNQGFKQENLMNLRDRQQMDQFINNGGSNQNAFQFQPLRHELNVIQQSNGGKSAPGWSAEFQTHSPSPIQHQPLPSTIAKSNSPVNGHWASEFGVQSPINQNVNVQQSHPNMMVGNYRPMMSTMPLVGNSFQQHQHQPQQVQNMDQVHQEPSVDWDNQFKQIEELTNEAKEKDAETQEGEIKEVEGQTEKEGSPEFVIDDKYQATFQEVWDGLNSEALEQDFITQQYEDFKNTQRSTYDADMNQWEKDFARYVSTRAHFGDYQFEDKSNNQFLDLPAEVEPYEIGLQLMENGAKLSEAALAFEAAIQKNENHIDAWLKLGEVQTQNEKEIAGVTALEKCLELHPENSEALMMLAISYINEGYDNAAFATLERWISTKYPQVCDKARQENPSISDEDRFSLYKRVSELFIKAAQLSPDKANMDADVQVGLGVLFYANEEFSKTVDCFKAALSIRPDDPLLWNRLGASLANSNRSEEAVEAYFKALQLKPTFVRARYNLGVSCINIKCYKEAAEHLLSGLSMHQVEGVDAGSTLNHNQSTALTETLKRAFIAMDRRDLLEKVKPGMDLNQFRGEFNF
ncbi:uncharacterized protein RJT21DRAFT_120629 [Scheffersomyces amazonensis]|uniref:uncharacterized protein n=1 Tax=Scheffersomyces amazonensis TaxID=1078765 RepID=UPI00315D33B3